MRPSVLSLSLLSFASMGLVALGASALDGCSNGAAPAQPDSGTGTPSADASVDGAGLGSFSYTPTGCNYTVIPLSVWAYTNEALDDTSSINAAMAAPQRVRLGVGGSTTPGPGYPDLTTTAAFTWETADQNHAAKVKMGPSASSLTNVYTGYVWTTPPPVNALGSTEPGTNMHEVHVCGLKPGTTYYYEVGGGPSGQEVWSAPQSFTTLPASGPVTIGLIGDARDEVTTWQLVNERLAGLNVAATLFSGDIVNIGTEEDEYTTWLNAIWQPVDGGPFVTLGQTMFLPIAGNHEMEAARFYGAFAIPGDGQYAKTYNSFNIGSVHFVMIDDELIGTQAGFAEANAQLAWITQDLTAADADRANHPFVIAMEHRGPYSTSLHSRDSDVLQARESLVPIYTMAHVDVVFSGHDHEYERTYPVTPGNPITADPVIAQMGTTATMTTPATFKSGMGTSYVICAGAGADPYAVGTGTFAYRADAHQFCPANMQSTCTAPSGDKSYIGMYATLDIAPTSITYKAYGLKGAGGADDMVDSFIVQQ